MTHVICPLCSNPDRVLCEKIEEGRFTEEYAVEIGRMLLRDNAIENFGLNERRKNFEKRIQKDGLTKP